MSLNIQSSSASTSANTTVLTNSNAQILQNLLTRFSTLIQTNQEILDTSETSLTYYLFNQLSALISDSIFYIDMMTRESSLVTAQLPQTINNWANYINYNPGLGTASTTNVTLNIPVSQLFNATIPQGFSFNTSDNIIFASIYNVTINMDNGISIYYVDSTTNIEYPIPYQVIYSDNSTTGNYTLIFDIPVIQQYLMEEEFVIPTLQTFQSYTQTFTLPTGTYPTSVQLTLTDNNGNVTTWQQGIIVQSTANMTIYQTSYVGNTLTITFGNGIQGMQPSGLANLYIFVTNGINGNISSNTIVSGNTLYSNSNPPLPVTYTVTNSNPATGGQNAETLEQIRSNAPLNLNMMNRVVSTQDYENILQILNINTVQSNYMLPVLKRSDLTTNDIYLYIVPLYNGNVIPADSIAYDITNIYNTSTNELVPTQVLTAYNPLNINPNQQTINWTNLFLIQLDYEKNIGTYYFLQPQLVLGTNLQLKISTATNVVNEVSLNYNMYTLYTDTYTLDVNTLITNFNTTYTQEVVILQNNQYFTYQSNYITQTVNNQITFFYNFTREQVTNITNMLINTYENGILTTTYYTTFNIQNTLSEVAYSYIVTYNNRKYLLDIPVISSNYMNSLDLVDQNNLFDTLVAQFMTAVNNYSVRMLNTNVSVKFARTYGDIVNNLLSVPHFYVVNILYGYNDPNLPQNPVTGFYYAISDPIATNDLWYQYGGYLATWTGNSWSFIRPGIGTIIINNSNNQLYSSDGRRWYIPDNLSLPLNIGIEVHPTVPNSSLYSTITQNIVNYINTLGINGSLFLSELIKLIQSMQNIGYARITNPLSDIIYRDVTANMTQEMLYFYTPEYMYTINNNITVMMI